jgi:hypothetical protein
MSDSDAPQEPRREKSPPKEFTWRAPDGFPVYGRNRQAPPPDFQRPWEFQPRREEQQAPPPPPVQQQQPPPPQQHVHHAQPQQWAAPQPPPQPMQQPPPPVQHHVPPPYPLGPALTPEERFRQLHGPPPGDHSP